MGSIVIVTGRLATVPEMQYTDTGDAFVRFTVASDYRAKQGQEWVSKTEWWRCTMFGKRAEAFNEFGVKGGVINVQGKITVDHETGSPKVFKDKEGNARTSLEMVVTDYTYFGQTVKKGAQQESEE